MNDDKRIDFSLLDPTRDGALFDREIAALIAESAISQGNETRKAAPDEGLIDQIAGWIRPALSVAVPIAAIAAIALLMVRPTSQRSIVAPEWTVADAVGIPSKIAEWSDRQVSPPPMELVTEISLAGRAAAARGR